MKHLIKSTCVDLIVFLLGIGIWHWFIVFGEHHGIALVPPHGTILMGIYLLVFSGILLFAHHRATAGLPYQDRSGLRRPSYMMAVCLAIALTIFIVARSTSNPVIWAMG